MPVDPVVAGYLAAVADDLDAALRLAAPLANRLAAYHLQQAAEKLVKAVLVHRRIHPGIEHRIDGPNASNVLAEAAEIEKLLDRARRELSPP